MTIKVAFFEASHIGQRGYNQDYFAHAITDQYALFVVADGLGGHQQGEIASKFLCEAIVAESSAFADQIYQNKLMGMEAFLKCAYEKMQQQVLSEYGPIDTHTTFVMAWLDDSQLITAHVGDSRLYRINENKVVWRTSDHTQVQTLFEQGKLGEDDMGKHVLQNQLTRTVNTNEQPKIEYCAHQALLPTETLILCSDGFWTDTPIKKIVKLANAVDYQQVFQESIAEMSQRSFADNITLQVVKLT